MGHALRTPRCSRPASARITETCWAPTTIRCSAPYKARRRSNKLGAPRLPAGAVLHPECAAGLAERHARITERDIPSTAEVEILTRSHGCVLRLLAHIQDDEPAVRGLDERIDALLPRHARVKVARDLERGDPRHVESPGENVRGIRIWNRRQELIRRKVDESLVFEVLAARRVVGVVPGLLPSEGAVDAVKGNRTPVTRALKQLPRHRQRASATDVLTRHSARPHGSLIRGLDGIRHQPRIGWVNRGYLREHARREYRQPQSNEHDGDDADETGHWDSQRCQRNPSQARKGKVSPPRRASKGRGSIRAGRHSSRTPPHPGLSSEMTACCYCLAMATRSRSSGSMKWS